jgi:hypothetical protein
LHSIQAPFAAVLFASIVVVRALIWLRTTTESAAGHICGINCVKLAERYRGIQVRSKKL